MHRIQRDRRRAGARSELGTQQEQILWIISFIAMAGVVLALAFPMLLGKMYLYGDLAHYHLPTRKFYADCLANHERPQWFPDIFCGYYLHGDGQVGMYHPLHWVLYRWFPLTAAFNLEILSPYLSLLAGVFLFARSQHLSRIASLFAAILFAFCGFNMLHLSHVNMVAIIAHLPWLLLAIEQVLCAVSARNLAVATFALPLLIGSMLLLGHPQAVWLCAAIAFAFTLSLVARTASAPRWIILVGCCWVGLLIGSVQWWETWEMLADSSRRDTSAEFRAFGSLYPANLIQFVGPYLFRYRVLDNKLGDNATHELGLYAGAAVPVLLVWLLLRWRHVPLSCGIKCGALLLAAVGICLSFGDYFPFVHTLLLKVPLIGLFRCPSRYCLLAYAAIAFLAAFSFADLARVSIERLRLGWGILAPLAIVPATSIAAFVLVALYGRQTADGFDWRLAASGPAVASVALSVAATILVIIAARGKPLALAALTVLSAADLAAYGISQNRTIAPMRYDEFLSLVPDVAPESIMRVTIAPPSGSATLLHQRLFNGYAGLPPSSPLTEDPKWFSRHALEVMRLGSVQFTFGNQQKTQISDPMPRARLVTKAIATNDIRGELPQIDCRTIAITDRPVQIDGGSAGKASLVSETPGRIQVETETAVRQLLIVSERYHPGWQAQVNGAPQSVVRTYGEFLGCLVPSGTNEVVFEFAPRSLRIATWVSLTATLLAGALSVLLLWFCGRQDQSRLAAIEDSSRVSGTP